MIVKIQSEGVGGGNTGSCKALVDYLEKENEDKQIEEKAYFFNDKEDFVSSHTVENTIDNNKKNLYSDDTKFYSVIISPSQKELEHIGNDKEKLKDYTRIAMNEYAENFGKDLKGSDLVYFAKIENERTVKGFDHQRGEFLNQKQGEKKEGLNTHIHVIVSRNSSQKATTKSGKQFKLSPQTAQKSRTWKTGGTTRTAGFDRIEFCKKVEKAFDTKFEYKRELGEKFEYQHAKKQGDIKELDNLEKSIKINSKPLKEVNISHNKQKENKVIVEAKKEVKQEKQVISNNNKKKDRGI